MIQKIKGISQINTVGQLCFMLDLGRCRVMFWQNNTPGYNYETSSRLTPFKPYDNKLDQNRKLLNYHIVRSYSASELGRNQRNTMQIISAQRMCNAEGHENWVGNDLRCAVSGNQHEAFVFNW